MSSLPYPPNATPIASCTDCSEREALELLEAVTEWALDEDDNRDALACIADVVEHWLLSEQAEVRS